MYIFFGIISFLEASALKHLLLHFADITPEMTSTFIEQSVRPGQHISFKCVATGSPPPQVNRSKMFCEFINFTFVCLDIESNIGH